jgi:hypothetical protein
MVFIYATTCIANGIGQLKPQMYCNVGAALLKIPITIFLARIHQNWDVVIVANIIIMMPCLLVQPLALYNDFRRKANKGTLAVG